MTPSAHIAATESVALDQLHAAREIVDRMAPHQIETFAALAGAPDGVVELTFGSFPSGTRSWALTYGLAAEEPGGALAITSLGRQAIELTAERSPKYHDLSLADVRASTQRAIQDLVAQSGVEIREPSTHSGPVRQETAASAIRRSGRELAERLSRS